MGKRENTFKWIDWIIELQSIAQNGLTYANDIYDIERYERLRHLTAEMMSHISNLPIEKIEDLFCNEHGYQTPKLDTRTAVIEDNKILLVQEKSGKWSLPGGWVDVYASVAENAIKETREEAGLEVELVKVIAIQDRKKHNVPLEANQITKVFFLAEKISGDFQPNNETIASDYFSLAELPELDLTKTSPAQIKICFDASANPNWQTLFD